MTALNSAIQLQTCNPSLQAALEDLYTSGQCQVRKEKRSAPLHPIPFN
ncbi:hypothetical protein NTGZN8_300018 [Candidatus Nitrotoga fabula]|uniref:Uncharacterized protein n=1 Tax=Candidatus Nitrotoga fabula TaxID=2182327 RepID=A0A916BEG5_9PROT|nr:hypothetical protein NTGZN8_300018 [Candidatus Nitrotoga fabula]